MRICQPEMTEQNTGNCAIVVSSVDHFSDLWPPFFQLLFRHWQNPEYPIWLISTRQYYNDPRVESFRTKTDFHWGTNLLKALDEIRSKYIIYLQDDYLLNGTVKAEKLESAVKWLGQCDGNYLDLFATDKIYEETGHDDYGRLTIENKWLVDLQAAIWKVDTLRMQVKHGWNPWGAECALNQNAKELNGEGYYRFTDRCRDVFPYIQGVKGGFWLKEAVDCCREQGIRIDLSYRPSPTAGQSVSRKLWRSFIKRRMAFQRLGRVMFPPPEAVEPQS